MKDKNQKDKENSVEEYWSKRYVDQSTGWDLGDASEPLRTYVDQLEDKSLKILIPGAGNAYEAEYLFRSGFKNIYIMDVSQLPLQNFKNRVPDFPSEQLIYGDFFDHKEEYDLILEQTFMCSFPPIDNIREKYIQKMYELLKSEGKLVGLWFNIPFTGDLSKRPFGSTKKEYLELFSTCFKTIVFEEAYNSVSSRAGQELFGIFKKEILK